MIATNKSVPDGWEETSLKSVLQEVDVRVADLPVKEQDGIEVLSLTKRFGLIPQAKRFNKRVATKNVDKYKVIYRDWIAYNPYVIWEGAVHSLKREQPGIVSPVYPVWAVREPDGGFIDFLLRTPEVIDKYQSLSSGAVNRRRSISKTDFLGITIPLPPLPEQKKIAHILSTVQRAIEAQERIIQTTTELFKVMLHKLMTAQIRVSDGRGVKEDFRETRSMSDSNLLVEPLPSGWKNFQFGEVCDRVKDSHSPVEGGETPYVGLEHLAQGFPAFVGRGTEGDVKSSKTAFKIGDILFGKLRPYLRKGVQADFDGISSTDILVFRVEDRCASDFLKYLVHSDEFIDYAKSTTSGVQHPRTSWPSLKEFHLSLPSLPEQKKIAHTLSVIQKRIDVAKTKKIKLEDLFRTLLHELMTAKIFVQHLILSNDNHE